MARMQRAQRVWQRLVAIGAALALLLCTFPALPAAAATDGMVRVRLTRLGPRSSLSFTTTCTYYVDGNTARPIPAGAQATVDVIGGGLYLTVDGAMTALGPSCTLARGQGGAPGIRFTSPAYSSLYCGDLLLSVSGGNIVPILRIYIEDYLYGVVGYEMSNSWPLEALKAQAVAARNYALRCMSTRSQRAYHVVDTSTDQVFRGYNGSQARVIQAVDGTRGLALYAGPSLAACYYSASNGGQTEATRNVWGGDLAYSVVKDDPYDLANPSATAKAATIRRDATGLDERLMQALRAGTGGAGIASILDIGPHSPKYAAPSRLYTKLRFTVGTADGRQLSVDVDTYGALETWYALGINPSDNETIYVDAGADAFTITFRRWGHGVGMSQRGAQAMAQQGLGFEDMLAFYYPGTQLRTLSLTDTTGSGLHDGGAPDVSLGQVACISGATLYASASTTSAAVGYVPAGALVEVYEAGETWSYLGYGGLRGWGQTALFVLPGAPSPSVTPAPTATSAPGRRAVVTMGHANGRLYLRSGPSTGTVPVGTVRHGDVVTAYGTAGEWTAVETGAGQRGYLKSKYLVYSAGPTLIPITPTPAVSPTPAATPTPTAAPSPTPMPSATPTPQPTPPPLEPRPYGSFARVALSSASSRLNLRQAPSLHAIILDRLKDGEYVEILADKDGWMRVETSTGRVGYVQGYYLRRLDGIVMLPSPTPSPTATPTPDTPVQGASYARVALSSASSRLNLRSAPSTTAAIAGRLAHGDTVRVLATNGSWVHVETASGLHGYVQSRYLVPIDGTPATPTPSPTATPTPDTPVQGASYARVALSSASSRLNLRSAPSTTAAIAGRLAHGDTVRVLATNGSWVHVETASGLHGYVQSRYLVPIDGTPATPTPSPTATPTPDTPVQGASYARVALSSASSRLNLRSAPSTTAAIASRLAHGDTVRVLATNGSWVHVETASGLYGYVQSRYLVRVEDPPTAGPGEAMADVQGEVYADIYVGTAGGSLHVRQGPSTQTPSVTTVSHGSRVQVLAVGDEWARVRTRLGNVGYLKKKYLVLHTDDAADGMAACDLRAIAPEDVVARAHPAADAAAVATIPAGTPLYVRGYNDEWAHVFSLSGASSGYVLKAGLRLVA